MVELGNITSIYEVSLATNFVVGYLILNYREFHLKSLEIILTQTKGEEFSENDNNFILKNGNKFSKKVFHRIKFLFIISIIISILSIFTSFSILFAAGLDPKYQLNNLIYTISSIIFIIVNPVLYFIYKMSVVDFENTINNKPLDNDSLSNFIRNYISIPIYNESILQKTRWLLYFKIQYIKSKLK